MKKKLKNEEKKWEKRGKMGEGNVEKWKKIEK